MRPWLHALLGLIGTATVWSAETLPPAPALYFNDYAGVVSPALAANLNGQLKQFERQTSNQVVVAVFPKMQSDSSLEDFTHRVMESWKVGQRVKNNGVGLFVFIADRRARIEVNYGLEGALPDATSKRIIEDEILPRFRTNDYAGGLTAGVAAIQQAIQGEYRGNGKTTEGDKSDWWMILVYLVPVIILMGLGYLRRYSRGGTVYDRTGRRLYATSLLLGLFGGGFGGGGTGGGGFSGGGGSGGGGGASGRW